MVLWGGFMCGLWIYDTSAILYPAFWISFLGVEMCFGIVSFKVCRKIVITENNIQECYLFFTIKRINWNEVKDIKIIHFPLQDLEMIVFSKCSIPIIATEQQRFYYNQSKAKQFIAIQRDKKIDAYLCKLSAQNNNDILKKFFEPNK